MTLHLSRSVGLVTACACHAELAQIPNWGSAHVAGSATTMTTTSPSWMVTLIAVPWIRTMTGMIMKCSVWQMLDKIAALAGLIFQLQSRPAPPLCQSLLQTSGAGPATASACRARSVPIQMLEAAKSVGSVTITMTWNQRTAILSAMPFTKNMIGMMMRSSVCHQAQKIAGPVGSPSIHLKAQRPPPLLLTQPRLVGCPLSSSVGHATPCARHASSAPNPLVASARSAGIVMTSMTMMMMTTTMMTTVSPWTSIMTGMTMRCNASRQKGPIVVCVGQWTSWPCDCASLISI